MMKKTRNILLGLLLPFPLVSHSGNGDTVVLQTFIFDSITMRRAVFQFPEKGKRYEKILMYCTL